MKKKILNLLLNVAISAITAMIVMAIMLSKYSLIIQKIYENTNTIIILLNK